MLVVVLVASGLFLVMVLGAISLALLNMELNLRKQAEAQALYVAEAGVNYYRWLLYHSNEEYCNGEACIGAPDYGPYGPYEYTDSAGGNITGKYELYIEPPRKNGSTIVNITSVGWVDHYPNIKRTIKVQCGIPSWSSYSTLCNSEIRFGAGTEVWGRIHSNGGIRFDGLAHNVISSALLKYDDPDHSGSDEYGVHTHSHTGLTYDPQETCDETSPPCDPPPNAYNDVFEAGRDFPANVVSFDLLDSYVSETLAKAEDDGLVLEKTNGNREGYHITLNPDDTIDIRIVDDITGTCWGAETYGIASEYDYLIGTTTPPNGILFVKDHVWIDGQINSNRLTVLAFDEPLGGAVADIIINNDLTYTNYDGTDAIGLIAQDDITVGLYSEDDLRIDAALVAKEGRIGRDHYEWWCGFRYIRDTITVNGALATNNRYGFAYTDGTGYQVRHLIYDNHLTFEPPPHYPTTGEYTFISWEEQ
jgi:hypothetical protein